MAPPPLPRARFGERHRWASCLLYVALPALEPAAALEPRHRTPTCPYRCRAPCDPAGMLTMLAETHRTKPLSVGLHFLPPPPVPLDGDGV
eukprot:6208470-Pleurochrysis_carterae.AAC.1